MRFQTSLLAHAAVALLLLSAFAAPTAAQTAAMTPERLWQIDRVGAPAVSPDGAVVIYSVTKPDAAANRSATHIWSVSSTGGAPTQLTTTGTSNGEAQWVGADHVAYLSNASGSAQVWTMAPDGTGARQVTDVDGGLESFLFAPDGSKLAMIRRVQIDPTTAQRFPDLPQAEVRVYDDLMMRHWASWADGTYSHLFVADVDADGTAGEGVDLLAGERVDTPLAPFGGREQIAWHPDNNRIAYTAKLSAGADYATSTNSDIFVYDVSAGTTTNVTSGMMGYDVEPNFSSNGRMLAWNSMATAGYEADRNRVFVIDLATGAKRELTVGHDYNFNHPTFTPNSDAVMGSTEVDGTIQLVMIEAAGGLVKQITSGVHNIGGFAMGGTVRLPVLIAQRQSMILPTDLVRINSTSDLITPITEQGLRGLDGLALPTVVAKRVPTTDGETMLVWEIRPPNFDPSKSYPAILYMQGGPQSALSQFFSYRWNFHALAAQGYVIVAPNRRGMPGHGTAWNEEISGDWGGQAMDDLLSAIDAAAEEPYVDADRLAAIGASYGGYSAYWLAGHHENRFKTIFAHAGVFNLESMYGATEELFFVEHDLGGPYWASPKPESYDRFSPHNYVANWNTPMLITHGEQDFRVPLDQGLQAYTALRRQGIEARFVSFPGEGHWINRPQNSLAWHHVVYDWLARYLTP